MQSHHALPALLCPSAGVSLWPSMAHCRSCLGTHSAVIVQVKLIMQTRPLVQTNFLYFGDIGIDFAFHLFFFARYSKMLELSTFHGRASDFVFMLLTIAGLLLVRMSFLPPRLVQCPVLIFDLISFWRRSRPNLSSLRRCHLPWSTCGRDSIREVPPLLVLSTLCPKANNFF